ncbi:Gfo/Idh/MocA family protein [Oceaniradius stylonematis]|uniref:Gfo/Idh/MocA family protein n=1 Tax=Oceaniradius stylonematis TaxID=2184161 RepID=UPI00273FA19B|nr:Gfo/Idh/MocA family oxidoreductase [Oceaniradius stylonematis]
MTLRYGVIGTGMMGQEHIRNIALLEGATVAAIADTRDEMRQAGLAAAQTAGMTGVAPYADHATLLSSETIDALIVVSPNDTHYDIMLDALATGLPILLEKPSATSAERARDLARRAHNRHAPVWVAMEYRYMPPVARLIEETRNGTAGDLKMISIVEHRYPFLVKPGNWNRFSHRSGGTMVEKCCHFFDLMRLITQAEPVRIFGSGGHDLNHRDEVHDEGVPDVLDNAFVIVDFDNGMRASLDLCMFAEGSWWQEHVSVTGSAGKIEAMVPGPSRFWPGGGERASEIVISPRADKAPLREEIHVDDQVLAAGDHHGGTFYQHREFARIVREGGKPDVSLTDGARAVEMGEAAERSIRNGEIVHLGDAPS